MKISKKLLFLLCITSISVSYGMNINVPKENLEKIQKMKYYAGLLGRNDLKDITTQRAFPEK